MANPTSADDAPPVKRTTWQIAFLLCLASASLCGALGLSLLLAERSSTETDDRVLQALDKARDLQLQLRALQTQNEALRAENLELKALTASAGREAHDTAERVADSVDELRAKIVRNEKSVQVASEPPAAALLTADRLRSLAADGAIGVAVIVCKRPSYLERTMKAILASHREESRFPIVISQDGSHAGMTQLVQSAYVRTGMAHSIQHQHEANAIDVAESLHLSSAGYVYIAQHFRSAMRTMFDEFGFEQVIFLEEDIEVSKDFFSYFAAMLPVLREDPTLYCVSAWNDNGAKALVSDPRLAYRTDFFPGLGWMLRKSVWEEVRERWPDAYWDEFMRRPDVRLERKCIRPDVSRSYTFGEEGTSEGQFFSDHLSRIKLNSDDVDWASLDLTHLASTSNFEKHLVNSLVAAKQVTLAEADVAPAGSLLRILYSDARNYSTVAEKFGLMSDEKEGVRRMSYRGVIPFAWRGSRVLLHTKRWPRGVFGEAEPSPITEKQLRDLAAHGATAVAIVSCKRPKYLERAMRSVLAATRNPTEFPIVISQDGFHTSMTQLVEEFVEEGVAFHLRHTHEANAHDIASKLGIEGGQGYVYIAQHFGFIMRTLFDDIGFQRVIFLEEDLEVSPDFFSYFAAMVPLAEKDPDVFCVSAWNDNGLANLVSDNTAVFRTDFFPGLGWLMTANMWGEVRDRWPSAFWDEFMRRPDVRKGRHCLRPEVSRTFTFGEEGTSVGEFFEQHLSKIKLNDVAVDWQSIDLSHIQTKDHFDSHLTSLIKSATPVLLWDIKEKDNPSELAIEYDDRLEYPTLSRKFGLMPDEKDGVRRMSYRGVIPFYWRGSRVYLHTKDWPEL